MGYSKVTWKEFDLLSSRFHYVLCGTEGAKTSWVVVSVSHDLRVFPVLLVGVGIVSSPVWDPGTAPSNLFYGSFHDLGSFHTTCADGSILCWKLMELSEDLWVLSMQHSSLNSVLCTQPALISPNSQVLLLNSGNQPDLLGLPLSAPWLGNSLKAVSWGNCRAHLVYIEPLRVYYFFIPWPPVYWKPLFHTFFCLFCCYCFRREGKFRPYYSILARWGCNKPNFNKHYFVLRRRFIKFSCGRHRAILSKSPFPGKTCCLLWCDQLSDPPVRSQLCFSQSSHPQWLSMRICISLAILAQGGLPDGQCHFWISYLN